VTAYSRLRIFTGGPLALGFLDVMPAERVASLHVPARSRPLAADPAEAVNELDAALFAALALDGRTPYAELATATGWSETTVRRRVDQLREAGVLYFDLEVDMPSFGFRSSAWLWLSVLPSHLADVGTALGKFPEVAYATATTGPANLAACAVCRDEESLYDFLTAKVGALPAIQRVETATIIRTVKQASPLLSPPLQAPRALAGHTPEARALARRALRPCALSPGAFCPRLPAPRLPAPRLPAPRLPALRACCCYQPGWAAGRPARRMTGRRADGWAGGRLGSATADPVSAGGHDDGSVLARGATETVGLGPGATATGAR
jgi:DNA-binding Lrp family transcriptional regulator